MRARQESFAGFRPPPQLVVRLLCGLAVAGVIVCGAAEASACPMCQAAVASARSNLVTAYMWSILFLMAMPFTLLTLLSSYMYWLVRKARAEQASKMSAKSPLPSDGVRSLPTGSHLTAEQPAGA